MTHTLTLMQPRQDGQGSRRDTAQRWLHVLSHTDPRYGGLSSAVPALGAALSVRHGLDISIAAFCRPDEHHRPDTFVDEHLSFWPAGRGSWIFNTAMQRAFAERVRRADGLHIHGLWEESTAIACRTARELGKPYVLSAHGMLEPWALANKGLKKRVYGAFIEKHNVARASCLHALTKAEAEQYVRFGARAPMAVVPNAVDLPKVVEPEIFLDRFPELRGKRLVLFLSRLHPKKGIDLLVEAWARVGPHHADARLVLAGPDTEGMHAKLTGEMLSRAIEPPICMTGMLTGQLKWAAFKAASAYVLPSYSEGLSMGLLEAMGMGLPVIATRACNMPEITSHEAGWEIGASVDALTSALSDVLTGPAARNAERGQNGARLIATKYSVAEVSRQMAGIYADLLGDAQPRRGPMRTGVSR